MSLELQVLALTSEKQPSCDKCLLRILLPRGIPRIMRFTTRVVGTATASTALAVPLFSLERIKKKKKEKKRKKKTQTQKKKFESELKIKLNHKCKLSRCTTLHWILLNFFDINYNGCFMNLRTFCLHIQD